jgi:hypothetical protein
MPKVGIEIDAAQIRAGQRGVEPLYRHAKSTSARLAARVFVRPHLDIL